MKYLSIIFTIVIFTACSSSEETTAPKKTTQEKVDNKYQIHNTWLLETINGTSVKKDGEANNTPQLEIFADKKQALGNDGCNQIRGSLKVLDEKNIVFGIIGGTKMACPDMEITTQYRKAISKTTNYKIENLKLYFYDTTGNELLQFKKID